ncbi:hypothetical protein K3G63_14045 [Hymenobacter sp. HSC-4F20]|uniref:hypothetical protein n=1 Tax=Hymenobacter sp. HSC-4F20 TaxID=2864135 RepID=UPI001C73A492|nr:hypothetical protein [Hymenobacter sp. HSC-4F20]MBX0291567.1 hypothetical protein [Hymenobacter sp. HSC-4F20]
MSRLGLGTAAQAAAPLARNTRREQRQFIQHVSAAMSMCERLQAKSQKQPLTFLLAVDTQSVLPTLQGGMLKNTPPWPTAAALTK